MCQSPRADMGRQWSAAAERQRTLEVVRHLLPLRKISIYRYILQSRRKRPKHERNHGLSLNNQLQKAIWPRLLRFHFCLSSYMWFRDTKLRKSANGSCWDVQFAFDVGKLKLCSKRSPKPWNKGDHPRFLTAPPKLRAPRWLTGLASHHEGFLFHQRIQRRPRRKHELTNIRHLPSERNKKYVCLCRFPESWHA